MNINDLGLQLIKDSEGLELKPYTCAGNIQTIGYGTTVYPDGRSVKLSDPPITKQQAEEFLRRDVKKFEGKVTELVNVDLNENEFSALVSFVYNIGPGAFSTSTLLRLLNQGTDRSRVSEEFLRWNKSNGRVLPGLVVRREKEQKLFLLAPSAANSTDNNENEPLPTNDKLILKFTHNTVIKTAPMDSSLLPISEKKDVTQETEYEITRYRDAINQHFEFEWQGETYFAFKGHIELINQAAPVTSSLRTDPYITLPGYQSRFYLSDPIIPGGHFTWAEATKGGSRIPVNKSIVENILAIALELEEIRKLFDNRPIIITSWYRDPVSNRAVGGVSNSFHLTGKAVDLYVKGLNIHDVQNKLIDYWYRGNKGGLGRGANRGFVHLDLGSVRIWDY